MTNVLRGLIVGLLMAATSAYAGPSIDLIVNDPTQFKTPADRCEAKVCTSLLNMIKGAKERIDFAVYGMRNQSDLMQALKDAKARGVKIRGVVDMDVHNETYYSSTPELIATFPQIQTDYETDKATQRHKKPYDKSLARCESPPGFLGPAQCLGYTVGDQCLLSVHASRETLSFQGDIMHHKFVVVDQRKVWTGSTNMSDSGTGGYNANLVLVIDSPKIAARFIAEMDQMVEEKKFHLEKRRLFTKTKIEVDEHTTVDLRFTPQDAPIKYGIRPVLQKAKKSIDIAVFFLTHKLITKDLIEAHRRGVKVRIIMDATGAKNGYTKHEILRAAGVPVKVETWGGKMHMKSAVVDDNILIAGSMNWTSAGERSNDENTLIIRNRALVSEYRRAFNRMWSNIPDKWLQGRPDPESRNSGTACTDGVDNDYDRNADTDDPGCGDNPPPLPGLPPHRFVPKQSGYGLIKGIVHEDGQKKFYPPRSRYYAKEKVDPQRGDQWFCSESEAWDAGFKRSRN